MNTMNIEYLRAREYNAVKVVNIEKLGHLNVICGKNNSGKSSLLYSLATKEHYSIGIDIQNTKHFRDVFDKELGDTINDMGKDKIFFPLISRLEGIQYSDNLDAMNELADKIVYNLFQYNNNIAGYVRLFIQKIFSLQEKYKPILIPPERKLESTTAIRSQMPTSPSGQGVTYKLFDLKNKLNNDAVSVKRYSSIKEVFQRITGYDFNISIDTNQPNKINLFFSNLKANDWIPADQCGLGLSDILVIITTLFDDGNNFLMIEEPETHLNPEIQRKLLLELKRQQQKQILLSTHSNVFLDTNYVDRIFYSNIENGEVVLNDNTSKSKILSELGYSINDNLISDLIILTEGISDIPVLRRILKWLEVDEKYNVKFWPLGGDVMCELDLDVFKEANNLIALIDLEGEKSLRDEFAEKCKANGIYCHKLKRYAIENYFTLSALKKVFKNDFPIGITEIRKNVSVESQLKKLNQSGKTHRIKKMNGAIINNMTKDDIAGTDLLEFCEYVKNRLSPIT